MLINHAKNILQQGMLTISLLFLTACQAGTSAVAEPSYGPMDAQELLTQYPKFTLSYENFTPTEQDLAALATITGDIKVKIFFGTWCHDSEREVPRFIKLAEQHPQLQYQLISLDYQKSDPDGQAERYQVKFTPTFVIIKDGRELGRIIERPQHSIAKDLADISQR
ncbi:TlpA family protein disulfide reductase [Thalassotalea mangrovi]|uniref:Thioredoxin family protein n=1 Tax=Thalassotalea mangrovi TaxID=2572245 RepID=A0A4U1B3B8_9GAMM|nr:thioredoxin family protein [Thalassotalea mangrovi]TKB44199.1 thioredoxin family protein [Thalassotalea mangrovi]